MAAGAGVCSFSDKMEDWVVQRQTWYWYRGIRWSTCEFAKFRISDRHVFCRVFSHMFDVLGFGSFDPLGFGSLTRLVTWVFLESMGSKSRQCRPQMCRGHFPQDLSTSGRCALDGASQSLLEFSLVWVIP